MDDLLSEDWQKPANPITTAPLSASAFASNYSSLRASPQLPQSGSASPANLSRPSSTVNGSRPPTGDSFGNLVSLKPQKAAASQSIQERQKQLLDEKKRQEEQQSQLWETLGSGSGTPEIRRPSPAIEDEDDILAAFSKDAPVNKASYFSPPPPSGPVSGRSTPAVAQPASSQVSGNFDEDDPFGLNEVSHKSNGHVTVPAPAPIDDDDDILGDLGKPVSEKPAQPPKPVLEESMVARGEEASRPVRSGENGLPADRALADRALAELVDMGFPADTARIALAENGGDVQSAVGWLLHQAHEESRQKARGDTSSSRSPRPHQPSSTAREPTPAWLRQEGRPSSASRRPDATSAADGETNASQTAQQYGTKLFKSANALWKASQKQMAKTMAEFQQDGDPNQPKWMREPTAESGRPDSQVRRTKQTVPAPRATDVTDEAAMLDAPRDRPQKPPRPTAPSQTVESVSRTGSPVEPPPHRQPHQPKFMQQAPPIADKRPTAKLSKNEVEEQTAQAYVSPARRKRPTPKPELPPEPEVDLFSSAPVNASSIAATPAPSKATPTPPVSKPSPSPAPSRPKVAPRTIPSVSPTALATSASHRKAGGEHFKRGDYAAAHESYTAALNPLPATHPIAIIVLSNRALTALKTGDAKVAVSDVDRALEIIGANLGADETIDLGSGESAKSMKEFYGKALTRKAEALEHMERYADAAAVWRQAIAAGVGGAVSLRGRDRCEKAAAPPPSTATAAAPKPVRNTTPGPGKGPPPKSLGNSLQRPTIASASSAEAVKKLRAANAEAEKADDEKFALADSVDAKLTAWRGGKTDNLRALLQSMDAVLWEGAGWKKVGMSDLVMPAKVKIVYMKAIGKVHPDKIPQDATTEQRMISAAVFATLNEAWDKFKKDNNL